MKTITKIIDYVFFKPVTTSEYYYVRCQRRGDTTHSWFIGYENSLGMVSSIGEELEERVVKSLESEYQNFLILQIAS